MLIQNECELSPDQQDFLKFVTSNDFPWFHTVVTEYDTQGVMRFAHTLMKRSDLEGVSGDINSPHYEMAYTIFKNFCDQNNVPVKKIFRASFNLTIASSLPNAGVHQDHKFPHNVFVMYLNDTSGDTQLIENDVITQSISPKKNKAIIFNNQPHTHLFPNIDEYRIVMVFTFE